MAVDTTNLKKEIADSSKDVADLIKSVNKLISDNKTLSSTTLDNTNDLASIYNGILGTVKGIHDTDKKNKLVEDTLKKISSQRQEILNKMNDLKKKGIILDEEVINIKKREMYNESVLNMRKLKSVEEIHKALLKSGKNDKDRQKFLEQEMRELKQKIRYYHIERNFLDERFKEQKLTTDELTEQDNILKKLESAYSNLSKKTSEWKETLKKIEPLYKPLGKLFGETGKELGGMVKEIANLIEQRDLRGVGISLFGSYISIVVDRFVELQTAAENFRKEMGLMVSQTSEMDRLVRNINIQYQGFGVGLADVYGSVKGLVAEFGNLSLVSDSLVESSALLKANYGVSAEVSAGFLTNMMRISSVSSDTAGNYAAYAVNLSKASGVPLPKIMQDVQNASETTLGMLRGNSAELIKAATNARKYGVEIEKISTSARKMLNFYESINDEMEASVMLGQQVSFQKARELAFAGKMVEYQDEVLNVVGQIQDFDQRSVLEKEALAKASGMELKDLMKMVNNKKEIDKLGEAEKTRYYELLKLNNQQVELTGKELLQQQEMQSAMTKLENAFKRIKMNIAEFIGPALNSIANGMSSVADFFGGTTDKTKELNKSVDENKSSFKAWLILIGGLTVGVFSLIGMFGLLNKAASVFSTISSKAGRGMRSISEGLASFAKAGAGLAVFAGYAAVITLTAMGLAYAFKMVAEGAKTFVESLQILASMDIDKIATSILMLTGSITALTVGFAASSIFGVVGRGGMSMTLNFLNSLVEMSTGLDNVAKSLTKIAESLLIIKNIEAFPKIKPIVDEGPSLVANANVVAKKEETQNDIRLLTESVNSLITYLKSGNAISTVYLDNRMVSKELANTPVKRA